MLLFYSCQKHTGGWQKAPAIIADEVLITATAINARSSLHTYQHTRTPISKQMCMWVGERSRNGVYISLSKSHRRLSPPSLVNRKPEVYFSLILFRSVGSRNISRPCRPLSLTRWLLGTTRQGCGFDPDGLLTAALAAILWQRLLSQKTTWLKTSRWHLYSLHPYSVQQTKAWARLMLCSLFLQQLYKRWLIL